MTEELKVFSIQPQQLLLVEYTKIVVSRNPYLSDILVAHPADLLDICGALGDVLE